MVESSGEFLCKRRWQRSGTDDWTVDLCELAADIEGGGWTGRKDVREHKVLPLSLDISFISSNAEHSPKGVR